MDNITIETLLETLGLQSDIETFRREDIDIEVLKYMNDNDLQRLGLTMGKRLKILKKMESITSKGTDNPHGERGAEGFSHEDKTYKEIRREDDYTSYDNPAREPRKEKRRNVQVIGNYEECTGSWMDQEIRIVLIGKTGSGKSATGNTILGKKGFDSSVSASSVTSKCTKKHAVRSNRKILIVDTPGIFDTQHSNEAIQNEIVKCISITSPGPHAFILVLSVSRFTEEEHKSAMHFVKKFGDEIYKYFIVLFTRKDDLDEENRTLFEHIKTFPPELRSFIQKCGGRVLAFNNRLRGEQTNEQVEELLSMILENIDNNDGKCYTDEMYTQAEKLIKEREEEELKNAKEERDRELQEIEKKLTSKYEKEKMISEANERYRKKEEKVRDTIRDDIEHEKGLFSKVGAVIDSVISICNSLNLFE